MEVKDCLAICNKGLAYTHDRLLHDFNNRLVTNALTPHIRWIQCNSQDAPKIVHKVARLDRIPNESLKKGTVLKPQRQRTQADDEDGEQTGDKPSAWTEDLRGKDQNTFQFEKPDFRKLGSDLYAGLQKTWSSSGVRGGTVKPFLPMGEAY